MDIFQAARANTGRHKEQYQAALEAADEATAALLAAFVESVLHDGNLSINMRVFVAENFMSGSPYENIYEFCDRMSRLSGRDAADIIKERLGPYCERRLKFDASRPEFKLVYYAALNIGGAGATKYGEICVVLGRCLEADGRRAAYLRGDSLNDYFDAAAGADMPRLLTDICAETDRAYLAVIKHAGEIPRTERAGWETLVCSNASYIEAIFDVRPAKQEVSEIRVPVASYDALWDIAFADFSRRLASAEKALANDFIQLLDAAGTARIQVRPV